MSKRKDKVSSILSKIITYILVVLLLLGFAGVIVYFVAKNEGVSFYVEYDGERYYSGIDDDELFLVSGENHSFSVKSLTGETVDYSVSVSSNGENNFAFVHNGEFYDFYTAGDTENNNYSEVFGLQKNDEGFTITVPEHFTVQKAIEAKYGGDIQLQEKLKSEYCYFVITVVSGENRLNLYFSYEFTVTLNQNSYVF